MASSAERSARTLLFTQRSLEAALNITPSYTADFTINTKYRVAASVSLPANARPRVRYFGIGVNGFRNVGNNLAEPHEVRPENMDLYSPIPFRIRTPDNDLSATERASYRMRATVTVSGTSYVAYYLKTLSLESTGVGFTYSGTENVYALDASNLNPTPPSPQTQGVIQGAGTGIEATVSASAIVTGEEIAEAVNVMFGGDFSRARISEIGLYLGHDVSHNALDSNSQSFSYTEAIQCELAEARTSTGTSLATSTSSFEETVTFSTESLGIS